MVSTLIAAPIAVAADSPLKKCHPMPALLHHELVDNDGESRTAPRGKVVVEFTIGVDGTVSDPIVVDTDVVPTKDWFNVTVLESIVKWKYAAVAASCRGRAAFNFTWKN
jgi:hypothetical protein